jgi:hypothetical protein
MSFMQKGGTGDPEVERAVGERSVCAGHDVEIGDENPDLEP